MKFKHVFATLGLASVMALGLGAALAHKQDIKAAKAEDPTWMFRVHLTDLNSEEPRTSMNLSNYRFRCWGSDFVQEQRMALVGKQFGYINYYAANVSFLDARAVTGCQFVVEKDGVDFYSVDIVLDATKANHCAEYSWTLSNDSLTSEKWNVYNELTNSEISIKYDESEPVAFVPDPKNNTFRIDNLTIEQGASEKTIYNRYLEMPAGNIDKAYFYEMIDEDSKALFSGSAHWASFKEYATYDFVLCGDNGFSGLRVHKHSASASSYVYYVTNSADATQDYAYTFGATQAFGAWPGIKVTEIDGVEEITKGVVHFQNNNVRIYKIPLNIGTGCDDQIIFNYQGEPKSQSANLYLKAGTALWWSHEYNYTNDQAGKALDFIVQFEAIRNAVAADDTDPLHPIKAYSICGISKADAATLVGAYKGLSKETRGTYVDCSKVLTYKADKTEGNEMISFADMMAYLAEVAEIDLNSNSMIRIGQNNSALIIIVISTFSVISLAGVFFIVRKRKHQ